MWTGKGQSNVDWEATAIKGYYIRLERPPQNKAGFTSQNSNGSILQCGTSKVDKVLSMIYFCLKRINNPTLIFDKNWRLANPKVRVYPPHKCMNRRHSPVLPFKGNEES